MDDQQQPECLVSGWTHEWTAPHRGLRACNYCGRVERVERPPADGVSACRPPDRHNTPDRD